MTESISRFFFDFLADFYNFGQLCAGTRTSALEDEGSLPGRRSAHCHNDRYKEKFGYAVQNRTRAGR